MKATGKRDPPCDVLRGCLELPESWGRFRRSLPCQPSHITKCDLCCGIVTPAPHLTIYTETEDTHTVRSPNRTVTERTNTHARTHTHIHTHCAGRNIAPLCIPCTYPCSGLKNKCLSCPSIIIVIVYIKCYNWIVIVMVIQTLNARRVI